CGSPRPQWRERGHADLPVDGRRLSRSADSWSPFGWLSMLAACRSVTGGLFRRLLPVWRPRPEGHHAASDIADVAADVFWALSGVSGS
ncbi:MAG: hypothetical protein ACRDQZ_18365, partial [Mycobacteriales bacterium]